MTTAEKSITLSFENSGQWNEWPSWNTFIKHEWNFSSALQADGGEIKWIQSTTSSPSGSTDSPHSYQISQVVSSFFFNSVKMPHTLHEQVLLREGRKISLHESLHGLYIVSSPKIANNNMPSAFQYSMFLPLKTLTSLGPKTLGLFQIQTFGRHIQDYTFQRLRWTIWKSVLFTPSMESELWMTHIFEWSE